jgi:hypothetical protein
MPMLSKVDRFIEAQSRIVRARCQWQCSTSTVCNDTWSTVSLDTSERLPSSSLMRPCPLRSPRNSSQPRLSPAAVWLRGAPAEVDPLFASPGNSGWLAPCLHNPVLRSRSNMCTSACAYQVVPGDAAARLACEPACVQMVLTTCDAMCNVVNVVETVIRVSSLTLYISTYVCIYIYIHCSCISGMSASGGSIGRCLCECLDICTRCVHVLYERCLLPGAWPAQGRAPIPRQECE